MSSEKTMLKAAFSHLELALKNMCEQARQHELASEDRSSILRTAITLEGLVSRLQSNEKLVASSSSEAGASSSTLVRMLENSRKRLDSKSLESLGSTGSTDSICTQQAMKEEATIQTLDEIEPKGGNWSLGDMESTANMSGVLGEVLEHDESFITHTHGEVTHQDTHIACAAMLRIMQDEFELLDRDKDLAVASKSLKQLCIQLGFLRHQIGTVFSSLERTHDGLIFQEEWCSVAKKLIASHDAEHIGKLVQKQRNARLVEQSTFWKHHSASSHLSFSALIEGVKRRQSSCIVSYKSNKRMIWDFLMISMLVYVSISLPVSFAFEEVRGLADVDSIADWLFLMDLLLNFRTTYFNQNHEEVWEPLAIAKQYLRTWFLLDLVSAFPFERIFADMVRLRSAKLLKVGKLVKVLKMLRLGKLLKIWEGSEFVDRFEEFVWESNLLLVRRGFIMLFQMTFVAHWTACLLLACGGDSTASFETKWTKYLVAMYWATMTVTTVGYGDVTMESDVEKIYAIVAMIVGGAFYGYIIGVVTTIISQFDVNHRAFTERMDVVILWLNNHNELSHQLRRRIWRHFKEFLTSQKAVDDTIILNDLPPQLLGEVSVALLKESVRANPLFQGLSTKALSSLAGTIAEVKFQADEVVVNEGDSGKAMFIVERGFLHLEKDGKTRQLCNLDSFGEEILLTEAKHYRYMVKSHSKVTMFRIFRDDFLHAFQDQGHDLLVMKRNFEHLSSSQNRIGLQSKPGAGSLLTGGVAGISPSFPDTVLERFSELTKRIDHIHTMQLNLEQLHKLSHGHFSSNEPKSNLSSSSSSIHYL